MTTLLRLVSVFALSAAVAVPAVAQSSAQQRPAGDNDDQIVITGCVMRSGDNNTSGPRSLLVWSKGDVFLESAVTQTKASETGGAAVGTSGTRGPLFYWIDDEDDFAKHVGKQVEIVGELSDLDKGEFEVEHDGPLTKIEIKVDGREAEVHVPSGWLGPATPARDSEFDIVVRRVDVEKVTVVGNCGR